MRWVCSLHQARCLGGGEFEIVGPCCLGRFVVVHLRSTYEGKILNPDCISSSQRREKDVIWDERMPCVEQKGWT